MRLKDGRGREVKAGDIIHWKSDKATRVKIIDISLGILSVRKLDTSYPKYQDMVWGHESMKEWYKET